MPSLTRAWNLETKIEHLTHLGQNLKMESLTAHLAAPLADTVAMAQSCLDERRRLRMLQLEALSRVNSLDRRLDILASSLSSGARQAERMNPALRMLGTFYPEGVNAVTKYSGRGLETEVRMLKGILASLDGMPEAAVLALTTTELRTTLADAETALLELHAIDDQLEDNDRRSDEAGERLYNAFYVAKGELMKLYFNNKRFIGTFFLN